jgi:hypothetical protein
MRMTGRESSTIPGHAGEVDLDEVGAVLLRRAEVQEADGRDLVDLAGDLGSEHEALVLRRVLVGARRVVAVLEGGGDEELVELEVRVGCGLFAGVM